jgi:hypothetical protein
VIKGRQDDSTTAHSRLAFNPSGLSPCSESQINFTIDWRCKTSDRNFQLGVSHGAQGLYFIDLLNLESSDRSTISPCVALIIQALSTCSSHVNCIVTNNASNLVRALSPDELTDMVQILSGEKALHVRCGCHSANLALEDLGREEAAFFAFENEVRAKPRILRRRLIKNTCKKKM